MACELTCGEGCCGHHKGYRGSPDGVPRCWICSAPTPEHWLPCDPLSHIYNGFGHAYLAGHCHLCGLPEGK